MNDIELYNNILGIKAPWTVDNVKLDVSNQTVSIKIKYDRSNGFTCSVCGKHVSGYDHVKRSWRHLDTCQMKTIIECNVPRFSCSEHGIKQIPVPWAESKSHFTALFEALAINWLKETSISGVANLLGLSWDQISGIQERAVKRGLKRREEKPLQDIAIDETSFQKRHEYVTIIYDKNHNAVLDVLDDRKAVTLEEWLKNRPKEHIESIKTVSMDMWDPFIRAIKNTLPNASDAICFDRFHVAQYFGKALDKVRTQENKILLQNNRSSVLKKTKHDWLRNSHRTDNRSRRDFMVLTRSTLKTARAWRIKETAAQLWYFKYRGSAEKAWKSLLGWICRCRLEPVKKIGRMIKKYLWGIINAIIAKASNAIAESKNVRIQRIKKMACGFRNRERFKNAILFHLGGLNLMPDSLENHG